MGKVTFEFDAEEDRDSIEMHTHCILAFSQLREIDHICRTRMKHGAGVTDEEERVLQSIRDLAHQVPGIW